jgi:AraC-like DNA-binding protein
MHSHVKLDLQPIITIDLSSDGLQKLSAFPLKLGDASYLTLDEGTLLIQSMDHYLVHIHLYEYKIEKHALVDVEVTAASFFMVASLDGCSILYNEADEVISEVFGNSCRLVYLKAGKYKCSIMCGEHQVQVLNIWPEWLIKKYGALEELRELIASYNDGELECFSLPGFSIGHQVYTGLRTLNKGIGFRDLDNDMHTFVNDCISRYLVKLHDSIRQAKSQELKAREIGEFVTANFADKIVGDEPALASHFMISTTMLVRLAKLYFGRPLHQQVIELRAHHGLKMLLATQLTVQEIAVSVGYEDANYFSRAFKKRFGITPNEVRICVI